LPHLLRLTHQCHWSWCRVLSTCLGISKLIQTTRSRYFGCPRWLVQERLTYLLCCYSRYRSKPTCFPSSWLLGLLMVFDWFNCLWSHWVDNCCESHLHEYGQQAT
jgi:hypothetical protein